MSVSSAPSSASPATRPDACPGALRPHQAADGALVRVRLPGGRIPARGLRAVAGAAAQLGDGYLELTSRANLQLRGLAESDLAHLTTVLRAAGLLPSPSHERVRNIAASPLSGLDGGGHLDVSGLVAALDAGLRGEPELAALGGRFLFALDDGRGDVAGGADAAWRGLSPTTGAVLVAGTDTGVRVAPEEASATLLAMARLFLRARAGDQGVWRIRDLPGGPEPLVRAALAALPGARREAPRPLPPSPPRADVGLVFRAGTPVARIVTAPFGRLEAAQAELLAEVTGTAGAATLVVTPWRGIVVPGASAAAESRMREAGLVLDPDSPWVGVSACAGQPGCAKALTDVRGDAARHVALRATAPARDRPRAHWSGCSRRCGRPTQEHLDVVAIGPDEYEITAGLATRRVPAGAAPGSAARIRDID